MHNLIYRVITVICLLPLVILAFYVKGYFLSLLLGVVSFVAIAEAALMIFVSRTLGFALAFSYFMFMFLPFVVSFDYAFLFFWLVLVLLINNIILFSASFNAQEIEKITSLFYWSLYIVMSIGCVQWLVNSSYFDSGTGMSFIWLSLIATWSNDTCAYFGGRLFGKHALFARVSQKKTWEGFIAGTVGMLLVVTLVNTILPTSLNPCAGLFFQDFLWICLPTIVLAPLGDLIESRFKRLYHIKDSSQILPGHGGILDRIDGLLMVLPWTSLYAFIIRPL